MPQILAHFLSCHLEQCRLCLCSTKCYANLHRLSVYLGNGVVGTVVTHKPSGITSQLCQQLQCGTLGPRQQYCYCVIMCHSLIGNEVVAQTELQPHKTIRHSRCELLVGGGKRCSFCESHRNTLRVLVGRREKLTPCLNTPLANRTNFRYLTTPEKVERLHDMRKRQHCLKKQLARLKLCL